MTYEERIAAAQAKMEAFKAKMAASAEKAKAARAMKKEEIAAAVAEINADLDDLDASAEAELTEYDAALNQQIDDQLAAFNSDMNAAEENIRLTKERLNSKIYALKLKAQMKAEVLREKLAEKRAQRDKAAMENTILDLLEYAQNCQEIAFAAAVEADLTLLEAAEIAAEYIEKYGEGEIEEIPEKVEVEGAE